jgi:glucose-6-phosphate isomerase
MSKPMFMNRKSSTNLTKSAPWFGTDDMSDSGKTIAQKLQAHAQRLNEGQSWVKAALGATPAQSFLREVAGLRVDASRQPWDQALRRDLTTWSLQRGLDTFRNAQFAGEQVNRSEARAARHCLLRAPDHVLNAKHQSALAATRHRFLEVADRIKQDPNIKHVIHIGIGGSDLGPRLLVQALSSIHASGLDARAAKQPDIHFAGNGDLHELEAVIARLNPYDVQIVLCSKSFSTAETLVNAERLKAWMNNESQDLFKARSIAITANIKAAQAFGVSDCFDFPDWVGGRFSLWSPIGLSAAVAIGSEGFKSLLNGAWDMDRHWLESDPHENLPWQLGLLDVWHRNAMHYNTRCVVPYDARLSRFPAYLQQLEMESNGKSVDQAGRAIHHASAGLVWGEPGTNAQHSFFQWLHQGTEPTPVEFIMIERPDHSDHAAHRKLLANALGQSLALLKGKSLDQASAESVKLANPSWSREQLAAHRTFQGGRASTIISLNRLDPGSLGALISLFEHRVEVAGFLWGINSFDQWGVELGKELAIDIENHMNSSQIHPDPQTALWIKLLEV